MYICSLLCNFSRLEFLNDFQYTIPYKEQHQFYPNKAVTRVYDNIYGNNTPKRFISWY